MISHGLTPKQRECLQAIADFMKVHGHSPSFEELKEGMGQKSKANVHRIVAQLIDRGHLVRLPGRARSLAIVTQGRAA